MAAEEDSIRQDRHFPDHQIDRNGRLADPALPLPWRSLDPLAIVMESEDNPPPSQVRADVQSIVFCYCFADARAEDWQTVAVRAHALLATLWPAVIAGRSRHELAAISGHARTTSGFPLADVVSRFSPECFDDYARVMEYYFPDGRHWLFTGTQNLYLIARLYQPGLVTRWARDLPYEQLAQIFGELPHGPAGLGTEWQPADMTSEDWRKLCGAARSRWSARAQSLIARKIQSHGGRRPGMFGKCGEVAEKYRQAAMGNQNRRK